MFVTSNRLNPLPESIPQSDWERLNEFMAVPQPGMEYVSEGYVGKTKTTKAMEAVIAKMLKKYNVKGVINASRSELDDCPEKHQLESLLKQEFGFHSAEISIVSSVLPGASSYPKSILLRHNCDEMPKGLTAHGERWYDVGHGYDYYMVITTEMFSGDFTPGEIVAFILHEVGHNFDVSTMSYIGDCLYWGICFADGAILAPFIGHILAKYISKFVNFISNLTPVALFSNLAISVAKMLVQIGGPFGGLSYFGMMVSGKAPSVRSIINMFVGFSGERFADSFTTAYGYGPELMSLIDKMDRTLQQTNKGFLVDTWTWSGSIAPTILNMLFDPHPEAQTRARLVLDDMKRLSEYPALPKNIKTAAKSEYERCKKGYDLFLQVDEDQRNGIALRFSREVKEAIFAGKCDLRTYLFNVSAVQAGVHVMNRAKKK
jgi:hypothetical protein